MATILCIETATTNCSVALSKDGSLAALTEDNSRQYSHAEKLHRYICDTMEQGGCLLSDLDAVAVSQGPGSYTGLRIGVSAAKGLCFAQNLPLIAVSTLQLLARQVQTDEGLIIPMLDARRMEAYTAVYDAGHTEISATKAEILTENSFEAYLQNQRVHFVGNAVEKWQELCQHSNAVFLGNRLPSARELCQPAAEKFAAQDFESLAYFEPNYLKGFAAGK